MKTFFIAAFAGLFCLVSCKKTDSSPINASIDGVLWQSSNYTVLNTGNSFLIRAADANGKGIRLSTGAAAPGYYDFKTAGVVFVEFLAAFNAGVNNKLRLSWKTANETNTSKFEVERSADGISFSTIGQLNAAGNSTTTLSYSFEDQPPLTNNNFSRFFYRIKVIHFDGSVLYSLTRVTPINSNLFFLDNNAGNYSFGFDGRITLSNVDHDKNTISGSFYFRYIDNATSSHKWVTEGKFTNLKY